MSPIRDSLRIWTAVAVALAAWTIHWLWPLPLHWSTHLMRAPYWWDAQLALWYLSESQHNLLHQPGHLLDARILHPAPDVLAYSENFLAWAVPGRLLGPVIGPVGAFNTWMFLAIFTSGLATYAWLRPRVASPWSALVGALFFAYAPWRLGLLGRLQLQSTMLLPLILLALEAAIAQLTFRKWLLAFGLFALQFGLCIYYGVYIAVLAVPATLALLLMRWRELLSQERYDSMVRLTTAALVVGLPLAAVMWPYLEIPRDMGLQRDPDELRASSGILRDLLTSSELMCHWQGLAAHNIDQSSREPVAFPGVVPLGLATVGALTAGWAVLRRNQGLWMQRESPLAWRFGLGMVVAWIALCGLLFLGTGPNAPGGTDGPYGRVFATLPLLKGLRFTNRFVVPATLFASVLVAWGTQSLLQFAQLRWRYGTFALGCTLVAALALELDTRSLPLVEPPAAEPIYQQLVGDACAGAVAELPMDGIWHTQRLERNDGARIHGKPTLGGFTGYNPRHHGFFREVLAQPFSPEARRLLASLGVNRLLIHWHWLEPSARITLQKALLRESWVRAIGGDGADELFAIDDVPCTRAAQIRAQWPGQVLRSAPEPMVPAVAFLAGAATTTTSRDTIISALTDQDPGSAWSPAGAQDSRNSLIKLEFASARVCGLWMDSRKHPHRFARSLRITALRQGQPPQLVVDDAHRQPLQWLTQAPARSYDAVHWPPILADALRVEVGNGTGDAALHWSELMVHACPP